MKVVLDTNTLVSAIGWNGAPCRLLKACLKGRLLLFTSPPLLEELCMVIARPKLQVIARHPDFPRVLAWLCHPSRIVIPRQQLAIVQEDPADNRVLECALEAGAQGIVSGDDHLLNLETFEGIPVLNAATACKLWNI